MSGKQQCKYEKVPTGSSPTPGHSPNSVPPSVIADRCRVAIEGKSNRVCCEGHSDEKTRDNRKLFSNKAKKN